MFFLLLVPYSLPPSTEGEWWELSDESRGGIPYYYQTKTGETVWERPDSFVIPLTIIQVIHLYQVMNPEITLSLANRPGSSPLPNWYAQSEI